MIAGAAVLVTAFLFGGMTLFASGFAAFLFSALPGDVASRTIRKAFPHFYLFCIVTAGLAAALAWPQDRTASLMLLAICLSTLPIRQGLMPAINRATDSGARRCFAVLHGLSVIATLVHIGLAGWALLRFT